MGLQYKYMVCVSCPVFNHKNFIKQAMDGFCMQKTNFPFVTVIIDDASTDGSDGIIHDYFNNNFDVVDNNIAYEKKTNYGVVSYARHKTNLNCFFAVIYLEENHYSQNKSKEEYRKDWTSNAKYMAICEGDDYWIDENKLQLQVDFLESNSEYAMCYTKCIRYLCKDKKFEKKSWGGPGESFEDFLTDNTVPTLTVMYTLTAYNNYLNIVKPNTRNWKIGDYPMWLFFAHEYKIKYLNHTCGVYRIRGESASHFGAPEEYKSFIESSINIVEYLTNLFDYKFDIAAYKRNSKSRLATNLAFLYNDTDGAREILKSLDNKRISDYIKLMIFKSPLTTRIYNFFLEV